MGKFLLGALVGIVVTILGVIVFGLVLGKVFSTKQPSVPSNAVLVLGIQGAVPEAESVDISIPFFERGGAATVRDLWISLRQASKDTRIKALVLQPQSLTIGSAKLQEIHEQIIDFKRSGKPVYAFLQNPGSREYYLASAADRIYLSPDDLLNVKGYRAELTYFKGLLDKVGINFQVDHMGAYKDAGDPYTRTSMTPQTREVMNAVLDQLWNDFSATVGQGRHKSADEMKALVDAGPYTASEAKRVGLIDQIGYEDQVYAEIKAKTGNNDLNKINIKRYVRAVPAGGDHIALLVGEGEISPGDPGDSVGNTPLISYAQMQKLVRQVREDSSIKGVILRVDSPGGDAVASDEILHELKLLAAVKPLVISFSDLAASGGYYISMTGNTIVSYPNTITGSIGVLYARPNVQSLLAKLGVTVESVSRGRLADLDSLTQPLSEGAQQKLHQQIAETYNTFVSKVATGRRRTFDQIEPLAQGHVWMGAQAKDNGLVDELGGFDKAVSIIRQKAHLSATGDTNLMVFPATRSIWEVLANSSSSSESLEEAILNIRVRKLMPGLPSDLQLRGGLLQLLPYQVTVQ